MPDVVALFTLAEVILKSEAASLHEAWILERPQDYDLGVRAYAESGLLIPAVRYAEAQRLRGPLLREFLATTLSTADVVLTPVLAQATPTLEACKPSSSSRAAAGMAALPRWTRWASFLGIPAVAVPCGFGEDGMPLSFQLAGRPFREDLLLRAAHAYQEATGWHRKVPAPV
jgi:aspartyl-tRNA(Asn)/glutamyl-tRNA(Gln) amidotransferase subunit A